MSVIMWRLLAAVLLLLSLTCSVSQAGVMTGTDLLDICEPQTIDPAYRLKISQCTGYIVGISDTFDCANKTLGFTWNAEKFDDQQKLVAIVVEWFHFHPNVLHYQASGLVASALAAQYPCLDSTAEQ